jgi:hypothetical protein
MRKVLGGLGLATLAAVLSLAVPAMAQTAKPVKRAPVAPRYDARQEVTLKGTVEQVVTKPSKGTLVGTHLMLATSSGKVDAHLGVFALKGNGGMHVSAGESVTVVGVKTTTNKKEVFLVRTVEAGGQTYTIRNEHGAVLTPAGRTEAPKVSPTVGGLR